MLSVSCTEEINSQFGGISPDHPALNNETRTLTDEDLADPPPGEMRKRYVHDLKILSASLAAYLKGAVAGPEGQQSPRMPKFQAIISKWNELESWVAQQRAANESQQPRTP